MSYLLTTSGYYALEFQDDMEDSAPLAKRICSSERKALWLKLSLIGGAENRRNKEQHGLATAPESGSNIDDAAKPPNEETRSMFDTQPYTIVSNLAELVFQCSGAEVGRLEEALTDKALLNAMQKSRQWRWERSQDRASFVKRTDCIVAMIPNSVQDISIMIRAGYEEGWAIVAALGFQSSNVLGMQSTLPGEEDGNI